VNKFDRAGQATDGDIMRRRNVREYRCTNGYANALTVALYVHCLPCQVFCIKTAVFVCVCVCVCVGGVCCEVCVRVKCVVCVFEVCEVCVKCGVCVVCIC